MIEESEALNMYRMSLMNKPLYTNSEIEKIKTLILEQVKKGETRLYYKNELIEDIPKYFQKNGYQVKFENGMITIGWDFR